ncbi:MAG: phosphatidylglycerophosphatase A [bacterium]|nr:phosphatidylglycerophosphatase A [bacterium]
MRKTLTRTTRLVSLLIASFFGAGYIRPASATWGSLASGISLFLFWPLLDLATKVTLIVVVFLLGVFLSDQIEKKEKIHDPYFIVIDEVVGMMITTLLLPQVLWQWVLAFFLFRFFDIAKLWPASYFDRRKGGFAIMFDDVLMGICSLVVLELILMFGV